MEELKPFLDVVKLKRIPVSDEVGGEIYTVTPKEFEKRFGCQYTEDIWGTPEQAALFKYQFNEAKKDKQNLTPFQQQVLDRLEHPFEDFVISFINDKVKNGIFATKDIPAGTILCIYSGTMQYLEDSDDDYSFSIMDQTTNNNENNNDEDDDLVGDVISAAAKRGLAGFFQHMPFDEEKIKKFLHGLKNDPAAFIEYVHPEHQDLKDELKKTFEFINRNAASYFASMAKNRILNQYIDIVGKVTDREFEDYCFDSEQTKARVATSNVGMVSIKFGDLPLLVMRTICPVKKGAQFGLCYSEKYWQKEKPELFTKDGAVLDHKHYVRKKETLTQASNLFIQAKNNFRQGKVDQAHQDCSTIINLLNKVNYAGELLGASYFSLGLVEQALGNPLLAKHHYQTALEMLNKLDVDHKIISSIKRSLADVASTPEPQPGVYCNIL